MQSQTGISFFPEQASSVAGQVDALYFFCIAITAFFTVLVAGLIAFFAIKYRRRSEHEVPPDTTESPLLEITWIVIPLGISMLMFLWGTKVFFTLSTPPKESMDIYVTGKQWMWKLQHVDGQREINQLHIPVGKPVKLIMTSEDVIHSFYVPAFRVKGDVLPGSYTKIWFEATKPGRYHLFCAEYCGTKHSGMIGEVIAMDPREYQEWLHGYGEGGLASNGQKLFQTLACNTCHSPTSLEHGPNLEGLYNKQVQLQSGGTITADESYIRESILDPNAKITQGFQPQMPTYKGVLSEEQVLQLIAYIKTVSGPQVNPQGKLPQSATPAETLQPPTAKGLTTPTSATPASSATPTASSPEPGKQPATANSKESQTGTPKK